MRLSKYLFWDSEYEKIDWDKKARYVIEKVVSLGTIDDWKQIREFYGLEKIKKEMLEVRSLDPKTHNFLSHILNVPKEKFRCYTWKQSIPKHFPF
ncbi:MAG: hypothetical protein AAFR87_14470 [Bacteroidota bacterium]